MSGTTYTTRKILELLNKKYGDSGGLMVDLANLSMRKVDAISTGSVLVDAITGIGGFPRGRVTELSGGFSSGKTTIALSCIARAQALAYERGEDFCALYLDYEHALDLHYARRLGVRFDDSFILAQPNTFETGNAILSNLVVYDKVDLVVIDSAAAMVPRAELEASADAEQRIGLQAALMSRMLTKVTKQITTGRQPAIVFLNQLRARINTQNVRANGEAPAGGNAMKYYTSMRIQLESLSSEGEEDRDSKKSMDRIYTGTTVRAVVTKNKVSLPWGRGTFSIKFGMGIQNTRSIAELSETVLGIMSGAGFFSYTGETPETSVNIRGRDNFLNYLEKNPLLVAELTGKINLKMREKLHQDLGLSETLDTGVRGQEEVEDQTIIIDSEVGDDSETDGVEI